MSVRMDFHKELADRKSGLVTKSRIKSASVEATLKMSHLKSSGTNTLLRYATLEKFTVTGRLRLKMSQ